MRSSRRLGTLIAAASLAAATAAPAADAYVDTGHGRLPVYFPHAHVIEPAHHSTTGWPLVAVGGAAAVALSAVALRTARPRARAHA
jgi:hypothetical protein